jgi:NAD(P)-dependent dehydrogenase (short-subunit alcohol dehydrogenase family)
MAIVLVTGASSGIGLATAVMLARGSHKVIATMRNLDGAGELRKIVSAEKLPVTVAALNVDDDASVNSAVGKALSENGSIDVLVNNAGIGGGGSVEEVPLERFREVMETNFFGALRCIKAVIPGMRERRHGCIVNITSVAGRVAQAPPAYAASKWAFEALSECLAQEMKAFNVRVAIIEPVKPLCTLRHLRNRHRPMSLENKYVRSWRVTAGNSAIRSDRAQSRSSSGERARPMRKWSTLGDRTTRNTKSW